ncbi:low molecular weight phosphotyrosine protein phosphatase [Sulfurimonas sp. HSL-3221]|uniref:low molecular weight protein-tyrosine-phosphatase n=1 Tax=Sulfurimonadaceae TaxID=2771471 RepID=UPI001E4EB95D|nr:low molecular weight protein-tyrosine-phosphatase [Sulfurimonas sp. HSL-3221]UFS62521.1 low molecular weight phosphotyrosine protein phosphatase [Sulfurimonas sp. HSL-3221]
MRSVLFVCLGNICRSPLAEAILRSQAEAKGMALRIDSAGTGSWHIGDPPCDHSVRVAEGHGLDIAAYRARQVSPADRERFDVIVGLDAKNVADLKRMGMANVYKLGDFGYGGEDVPDPYFFPGFEGFEKVFTMIETCCTTLITRLETGLE